MNILEFTILLPPVTKKNSQQILVNKRTGKPFIMPSKKYKDYVKQAGLYIPKRGKPLDGRYNITCLFFMPTRRRVDLTNLLEAIDDVMVETGLLADDHSGIIVGHDGSRVDYDKDNPRTCVAINEL